jgi:hypothetical protein
MALPENLGADLGENLARTATTAADKTRPAWPRSERYLAP